MTDRYSRRPPRRDREDRLSAGDEAEATRRVVECVGKRFSDGASAAMIATAFLGAKARRHNYRGLEQIGLGIASRLCVAGLIAPTRSNRFVLR